MTVASHNDTAALTDVLFGDVWLCGGQSNMYFNTSQVRVPAWAHPHRHGQQVIVRDRAEKCNRFFFSIRFSTRQRS